MSAHARARDEEARRLAQTEFRAPLVVEAGAGTGKTATLVARIATWCLGPGWERVAASHPGIEPDGIAPEVLRGVVAITFTEAAAAEMASKVGRALLEIESGEVPLGVLASALPADTQVRRERARALLGALDQLGVRTIHAFCRRLLAEHPLEASVHPRFAVDADESGLKAAARRVLEGALPELLARRAAMLVLARSGQGPKQIEEALLALVRQGAPADALDPDPLAAASVTELRDALAAALDGFLAADRGRLAMVRGAPKASDVATRLQALRERVLSLPSAPRASAMAGLGELCAAVQEIDLDYLGAWAENDFVARAAAALGADTAEVAASAARLAPRLEHVAALDPVRLDAARDVLAPLLRTLWGELRAQGVETFPALLRDARDLLTRESAVCHGVRSRIQQILVDEFQDTDRIQCELVARLALEGAEGERPGLFLVGDPKQSIYGWRDADLQAYDEFVDRVLEAGGRKLSLVVNHRSAPPILDEVERVIAPLMQRVPGLQPAFEPLLPGPRQAGSRGFEADQLACVEHWVSWDWDAEASGAKETTAGRAAELEAAALAAELVTLHERHAVPWSRIGLLFRGGTDLETYLAELRRAGVPFAVEGDRSYFQRREIIEAGALLRCVLDPHDQLALVTLLRSAMVGVPDAALIPLWAGRLPDGFAELHGPRSEPVDALAALAGQVAASLPATVPGVERVAGWEVNLVAAARSLAQLRASFESDPADTFVEQLRGLSMLEATEAARYLGPYRVANLDRFFRDLLEALRDGEGDPQALLRALRQDVVERREAEEGRPKEAAENAVQVLTIHKAKGLDFAHVYVLQLHKGRGPDAEARIEEVAAGRFEYEILGARSLGFERVLARRAAVEEHERVRTLYVALTRAEERLVVAGLHRECAKRFNRESHIALLESRQEGRPDLVSAMGELGRGGSRATLDECGARWCFPALRPGAAGEPRFEPRRALLDRTLVERGSRELAAARARAASREARAFHHPISRMSHEAADEAWRDARAADETDEARAPGPRIPSPQRDAAMASGSAVHRALERIDLAGDLEGELLRAAGALEDERARELLGRLASGPLLARLRAIAPHVVARELPVLLPPDAEDPAAPVGFLAGAVDLLYRDPASGEWVVADWKTDRIEGPADIEAKAPAYALQGAGYVRAVRDALGLDRDPRFELWLLDAGEVRVVEPDAR